MRLRLSSLALSLVITAACGDVVYRSEPAPAVAPPEGAPDGGAGDAAAAVATGDATPPPAPRNVETLYTGPALDAFAACADDLFVTGTDKGFPMVFRVAKSPPRKPWSFTSDLGDPTTDRLRMAGTEGYLYYETTGGDLRKARKDPEFAPAGVDDRAFVDHSLSPKIAAVSATRLAFLAHDGLLTDLQVTSDLSTVEQTVIGKKDLDLGPVAIDEVITVFVERPGENLVRYEPNEGRTPLGPLPATALALAIDTTSIYAALVDGRVVRMPRTGGAVQDLLTGLGAIKALTVTDNELLVLTDGAKGRLIGCKPASCSATKADLFTDVENAVGLGTDAKWIYVAERGPASGNGRVRHIQRAP